MTFANKGHKHSEQQLQWLSKACWLHSSIHDIPVTTLGLAIKDCKLICSTWSEGKEITQQRQHGMGNSPMVIWIFGENLFVRVKYKLSHSILFKRENDTEFFLFLFLMVPLYTKPADTTSRAYWIPLDNWKLSQFWRNGYFFTTCKYDLSWFCHSKVIVT